MDKLRADMIMNVVLPIVPEKLLDKDTKYYINPTGRFVVGGPQGDSGLTGRKIIVDTYGGYGQSWRRCFLRKGSDKGGPLGGLCGPLGSKKYRCGWVWPSKCEIQLAYAIGVAHPVSVMVDSFGTGTVSDEILAKAVEQVFDLRPAAIIQRLDLRRPIYRQLAAYGHMGREDLSVAWEKTDRTEELKQAVKALK